jgi:hypothetical protein
VSGLILGAWLGAAPTRAVERPGVQDQTSAATQQADAPEPAVARQETSAIRQPAGETWHEIEVYFSRRPESDHDFTAVFPAARRAPDAGVATGALRELIAGPTLEEAAQGYFSELGTMFVGPSNCGDHDFTIRIENGPEGGTATVRFCRTVTSAGIGQDARVQSALEATLRQFPTIQRVRLLDPAGDCLFDMSGENRCLAAPGDRP